MCVDHAQNLLTGCPVIIQSVQFDPFRVFRFLMAFSNEVTRRAKLRRLTFKGFQSIIWHYRWRTYVFVYVGARVRVSLCVCLCERERERLRGS